MASPLLLDGRAVAKQRRDRIVSVVEAVKQATGEIPCLVTILVGDDPASVTYTQMKRRQSEAMGMRSRKVELPAGTTTEALVGVIRELGADPTVHGILLQHPCAPPIDERPAFEAIPASKDVDGVTLASYGAMAMGLEGFDSATPGGIMRLLDAYDVPIEGAHAVVIGRSPILGKPQAALLLQRDATVTVCHSRTRELPEIVRQADILVAAVGRAGFVRGDWIKPGAVVVDAGYNEGNVGDVDYEGALTRAGAITPVPGGVGPMTISTLLEQTAAAAARQLGVVLPVS